MGTAKSTTDTISVDMRELITALRELVDAGEYVKPFAGAVAVKAAVKDIRQAGNFVAATERAKKVLRKYSSQS